MVPRVPRAQRVRQEPLGLPGLVQRVRQEPRDLPGLELRVRREPRGRLGLPELELRVRREPQVRLGRQDQLDLRDQWELDWRQLVNLYWELHMLWEILYIIMERFTKHELQILLGRQGLPLISLLSV